MFRNIFRSVGRGIGYSLGKLIFWLLLGLLGLWLSGSLYIQNALAASYWAYGQTIPYEVKFKSSKGGSWEVGSIKHTSDAINYSWWESSSQYVYTAIEYPYVSDSNMYRVNLLACVWKGTIEADGLYINNEKASSVVATTHDITDTPISTTVYSDCVFASTIVDFQEEDYFSNSNIDIGFRLKRNTTTTANVQVFVYEVVDLGLSSGTFFDQANAIKDSLFQIDQWLKSHNNTFDAEAFKQAIINNNNNNYNNIINNNNSNYNNILNSNNSNKNEILSNQNSNSQQQISNENKNHEEMKNIYNDETENSDGTCKGIICNLKKVVKGIINLPQTLINAIINALKSLFIPEDTSFINNFVDSIETKLGFIGSIPAQLLQFIVDLGTSSWDSVTSLQFPKIEFFGVCFWDNMTIDLSPALGVIKTFKYLTDMMCVILCANTLLKWFENFTGGGKS